MIDERGLPDLDQFAVVIVMFMSADVIAEAVADIPDKVDLVVVDNASPDRSLEAALDVRPDATLVRASENRGFGAGCNLGWRSTTRPFILFLNPDCRIDATSIMRLGATALAHPGHVVGPRLLESGGQRRPLRRTPSTLHDVLELLPFATRFVPSALRTHASPEELGVSDGGAVGVVEGACFCMRRSDLDALNGFDEALFLYGEEADLARRLARRGGGAWYEPRAVAVHIGATATQQIGPSATYHMFRSRVVLIRQRHSRMAALAATAGIFITVILNLPLVVLNTALHRRRARDVRWWLAAISGIAAGAKC